MTNSILLGAIADDLTGATDLALMLARNGMKTVQVIGVPEDGADFGDAEAVVVALKSRTIDADDAVAMALAGLSGLLYALVVNGIKWDSGLQILLLLFAAVTLGGLGTAFGALIGALIIGLVVEVSPVVGMPGDFKYATALLILILLLLVRPQGLLGKPQRVG